MPNVRIRPPATCHPDRQHVAHGLCRPCYDARTYNKFRSQRAAPFKTVGDAATDAEIAWAAGVYEGEGSTYKQRRDGLPVIKIAMSDEDVIRRVASILKVGSVGGPYFDKRKPSYKPLWRWTAYGSYARNVLEILLPWMGERRRQKALEVLDDRVKDGSKVESEDIRDWFAKELLDPNLWDKIARFRP